MIVVVSHIRVTNGNGDPPSVLVEAPRRRLPLPGGRGVLADALATPGEVLRRLSAGVYAAVRSVLAAGRDSVGEVSP